METCSDRLLLSPFTPSDLEPARELLQDPDVVGPTGFRTVVPDWDIPAKLGGWVDQGQSERGIWKVRHKLTFEFVGMAMLKDTTLPHPELGYMLVKRQWGKGYATEIAGALLQYGFGRLRLDHIMAATDADNAASIKVLAKVGMSPTTDPNLCPGDRPGMYFIKARH